MINIHGTACQCWQCQMYTVPVSTTVALPTPQPACAECGHDEYKHYDSNPKCGQVGCSCPGYRPSPPVAEPKCGRCEQLQAEINKLVVAINTAYCETCAERDGIFKHLPATTEPTESSEKNLVAKIHLSDEDAVLLEEFRNAVQKPTAPPEDAKALADAFVLAKGNPSVELNGNILRHWMAEFAEQYAAKLLAERDRQTVECGYCGYEKSNHTLVCSPGAQHHFVAKDYGLEGEE